MSSLPSCWYCPECGISIDSKDERVEDERYDRCMERYRDDCGVLVEVPIIPPGSPLTVIIDTLSIEYREGWENRGPGVDPFICFMGQTDKPVLVVDIPATDEAQA